MKAWLHRLASSRVLECVVCYSLMPFALVLLAAAWCFIAVMAWLARRMKLPA